MGLVITGFDFTERFRRELASAPPEVREALRAILIKATDNAQAGALRFHALHGYRPKVFKFDVMPNQAWQVSFELDGSTAVLMRLCTHKEMDRRPR